jgi:hypothetical protein
MATIVAYGVAYYSYGALIDPIRHATGWSAAARDRGIDDVRRFA